MVSEEVVDNGNIRGLVKDLGWRGGGGVEEGWRGGGVEGTRSIKGRERVQ